MPVQMKRLYISANLHRAREDTTESGRLREQQTVQTKHSSPEFAWKMAPSDIG